MKIKKKISAVLTAAMLMTGLTGCAGENQIPDFTQDEVQEIGEFVALTVMKYDINHRSRLMDLEVLDVEKEEDGVSATPEPEETSGMPPVADTPVVDASGKEEAENAPAYSLEEVMGLPEGLAVTFVGQASYESYPEDGEFFSVNASEGKKLLVLQFSVTNNGAEEKSVNILDSDVVFTVKVNETYSRKALPTILLDDLSTYIGTVPAGGTVNTVIVIQVEEEMAENISSLSLNVKNGEKASTIKLL